MTQTEWKKSTARKKGHGVNGIKEKEYEEEGRTESTLPIPNQSMKKEGLQGNARPKRNHRGVRPRAGKHKRKNRKRLEAASEN